MKRANSRRISGALIGLAITATTATSTATAASAPMVPHGPTVPAHPSAWAQFRFDDRHSGFDRYETRLTTSNVASLVKLWSFQSVLSPPAVIGRTAYINTFVVQT